MPDPDLPLVVPASRRGRPRRRGRRDEAAAAGRLFDRAEAPILVEAQTPLAAGHPPRGEGLPLSEMAGGIAHDFRNVLAVIASALDLAQRHRGDEAKLEELLGAARDAVDRAAGLASRLLVLGRPAPPAVRPENLSRLIRDSLPFLRYAAGPRNRLRLELCEEAGSCAVDSARFNSALLNLVANARDAMPEGGEIVIATSLADEQSADRSRFVRVRVCDSGEGIAAEVAERIFDPWFTTKAEKGTGLGLPQVQRLMQLVGGRVAVTSGAAGTCFDLLFPIGDGAPVRA